MLLKRLELQGFKSFADKTVLSFVDGATAVVGPNGSGKSNISDAIRWVIGEMSAKSLRGSNMQDVIFAGTSTRKPVNYAEVSLVLDNSSHIFDIDFDEVTVTRRLFRSGESVYQINRANCRLKDIHELFMDTGLGRDGYSIIGQGNVAQILSTKAEDRRSLFEEAAGVSKYKYRKEDASRKLASVEENLVRINDITSELEGRIEPLRKQSEKAREYIDLYGEYKTLDVNLSLVTLEKNSAETEEAERLYKSVEAELSELRSKESETERRISSLYDENKAKDAEKTEQNERLRENESRLVTAKNDVRVYENNIKNNHANIRRIEAETSELAKQNEERRQKIAGQKTELEQKEALASEILGGFDKMHEEHGDIDGRIRALASAAEEKRAQITERTNAVSAAKAKLSGIETLRESFIERRRTVEEELRSFSADVENTKREMENTRSELSEKRAKAEKLSRTAEECREKRAGIREKLNALTEKENAMKVDYNSKASKRRILEGMENDYAGYAKSVKAVLKAPELKGLSIYGTLSGLIDVKREYVTAIETALGGALQNIVVGDEEDAKQAIEFLRRTKGGRATFLPVSSVSGRVIDNIKQVSECGGYIGAAPELIRYDKKYDGIIKSLLGRVVVVDDIDSAIAMSRRFGYKFRVVTLKGDVLNAGGSMSGGSVNKQSGFLSRATEIKELAKELSELEAKLRTAEKTRSELNGDLSACESSLNAYLPALRNYEDEILRLDNTLAHLSQSVETSGSTEENYKSELEQLEKRLAETSEETAVHLAETRRLESEAEKLGSELAELDAQSAEAERQKEEKSKSIMDETVRLANLQKETELIRASIKTLEEQCADAVRQSEEKRAEAERINDENDRLYASIREKNELTEELQRLSEEITRKLGAIDEQKARITDTLKSIQNSNKDLTDKLLNLQQELSRAESKRARLNSEKESTINRLWDEYELTLSAAEEMRSAVENTKEAFKRLSELKGRIKALGSVNVDAIEEYKSVKERWEFMTAQKTDLEKSKSDLLKIIDSMEELMEEHFGKQLESINKSFSEVFSELFGGGSGKLYLSDPENILESGIEIEVQLPGKGLQNINLYSGGEKSFIAIALLFAILKVKPTPFCILDEIDAALDDVNVSRFATYLKNYTDRTQFIVITHRRGTMEAANILYGVTMQEKGVSKLLSLQIDDVEPEMAS
ncbi:MAG TPA: chromosome segregation protein SMC [Candidatus Ornithomonoglobus intestinigallinarum]|uniref:Chromosome partition protein Smc n=1 Tax=Candidatus Ornithomonoglobus intestinigallinarum TaxID=2840894 RepID=A0A9D1H444_9FIRM|nr:chromosome segregation protein SMC [Candidatus Ornithomonoglobus intestinigallinarum]